MLGPGSGVRHQRRLQELLAQVQPGWPDLLGVAAPAVPRRCGHRRRGTVTDADARDHHRDGEPRPPRPDGRRRRHAHPGHPSRTRTGPALGGPAGLADAAASSARCRSPRSPGAASPSCPGAVPAPWTRYSDGWRGAPGCRGRCRGEHAAQAERRRVYPGIDQVVLRAMVVLGRLRRARRGAGGGGQAGPWQQVVLLGLAVLTAVRPESIAGVALLAGAAYIWALTPESLSPLVLLAAAGMVLAHVERPGGGTGPGADAGRRSAGTPLGRSARWCSGSRRPASGD